MSLLSFGFKRSAKSNGVKRKVDAVDRVFISDLEDEAKPSTNLVIPKLENSFCPGSKNAFVPSFVPQGLSSRDLHNGEERFEAEEVKEAACLVHYGLQSRPGTEVVPETPEFVSGGTTNDKDNLEAFKAEVRALPDEANAGDYERMPVEGFGLAMLKGMDWKEGQVLGRKKDREAIHAIEYVPRASRLGLGAAPDASKKKKAPVMVLPKGLDGRVRHVRTLDEKLVPYEKPQTKAGDIRRIISGIHEGLQCTVVKLLPEGEVSVRLPNEEEVHVQLNDLGDVHLLEASQPKSKKQKTISKGGNASRIDNEASWLMTGIRVRIVDKKLENGHHYLKKGVVVDIVRPGVAHVLMDEGQILKEDVKEISLETVVPRKNEALVKIVKGSLKGAKGKLLQRKSDEAVATVQLLSDLSVCQLAFDDMAEYVRA